MRRLTQWFKRPFGETSQIRELRRRIEAETNLRVIVNASPTELDGWIATEANLLDPRSASSWGNYFHRSSLEAILAEHVWDEWTLDQGLAAARSCFQYLLPGGYLRVAVPDGFHPSPSYLERVRSGGDRTNQRPPRTLYNYISITEAFRRAGFQVRLIEYFDENGLFHTNHWDVSKGLVQSSLLFDERNEQEPYGYTSLFIDAVKPDAAAMGVTAMPSAAKASSGGAWGERSDRVESSKENDDGQHNEKQRDAA